MTRTEVRERLIAELAYLEHKGAPDVFYRMLEAAAEIACDHIAWTAELQDQEHFIEPPAPPAEAC